MAKNILLPVLRFRIKVDHIEYMAYNFKLPELSYFFVHGFMKLRGAFKNLCIWYDTGATLPATQ